MIDIWGDLSSHFAKRVLVVWLYDDGYISLRLIYSPDGYPDMEIAEIEYDEDSVEKAYEYTKEFLNEHPDLAGIACCNMSNPVGAARAVIEAGREDEIVIVGMDHDQEALQYLRDGIIYALGVQDCYSIGFDTIQVAVKIADENLPGEVYPEKTEELTTIIYQDGAAEMLQVLYGEIS